MLSKQPEPRKIPSREERLKWLDARLRADRYPNPTDLQEEFGISERTAYSDVEYLRDSLGALIKKSTEKGGWYYVEQPTFMPLPAINPSEVSALRRALLIAHEYLGDSECAALERLSGHISHYLPAAKPGERETARGASHLLHPTPPDTLLQIFDAMSNRQKIRIRYKSPRRENPTERIIRPYHLDNVRGEWYLLAHCELRDAIRMFHTARIQHFDVFSEPGAYSIPTDFDSHDEFDRALLHETGGETQAVVVEFDTYQAPFVRERVIHPSEEREELPSGSLRVTLQITAGDELKRWLLGYGRHVMVLEPEGLRREMAEEIAALQKMYQ